MEEVQSAEYQKENRLLPISHRIIFTTASISFSATVLDLAFKFKSQSQEQMNFVVHFFKSKNEYPGLHFASFAIFR